MFDRIYILLFSKMFGAYEILSKDWHEIEQEGEKE